MVTLIHHETPGHFTQYMHIVKKKNAHCQKQNAYDSHKCMGNVIGYAVQTT